MARGSADGEVTTNRLSDAWIASPSGANLPAHRTLAEKAFISLREAILTGSLRPGERIPIDDLARALDMSPMPVREAIRRLDALGLVENIPHKGARITELSIDDLRDIYEARLSLEPLAVARAAQRFTDEDHAAAKDILSAMRAEATGSVGLWRAHSQFHMALYRAGGSPWLIRLIQPLWESSERYRLAMGSAVVRSRRLRMHEVLLHACAHHEAERAAFELNNHLVATANTLAGRLGSGPLFSLAEGGSLAPHAVRSSRQ